MSNAMPQVIRLPEPSLATASEFGADLYSARVNLSDPEECFSHLHRLYPHRWREIMANASGAIYEAEQMYCAVEISRPDTPETRARRAGV